MVNRCLHIFVHVLVKCCVWDSETALYFSVCVEFPLYPIIMNVYISIHTHAEMNIVWHVNFRGLFFNQVHVHVYVYCLHLSSVSLRAQSVYQYIYDHYISTCMMTISVHAWLLYQCIYDDYISACMITISVHVWWLYQYMHDYCISAYMMTISVHAWLLYQCIYDDYIRACMITVSVHA